MSQLLHLSKLDFSNRVNEIAFQTNKKPIIIEKQYYVSLLWKLIQQYMNKVVFNKTINDDFVIDGEQLNIHQNFLDWKFLCNYLFNMFDNYKLRFDFNLTTYQTRQAIRCVLFYESVLDETTKTISFILVADNTATHETESDNDNKNSNSGGNALEKIKLNIKAMKEFSEKAPKISKQGINIFNNKQFKAFSNEKKNQFNIPKNDFKDIKNFVDVTKSVVKNNGFNSNKEIQAVKSNINNTFSNKPFKEPQADKKTNQENKATFPPTVEKDIKKEIETQKPIEKKSSQDNIEERNNTKNTYENIKNTATKYKEEISPEIENRIK